MSNPISSSIYNQIIFYICMENKIELLYPNPYIYGDERYSSNAFNKNKSTPN